MNAFILGVYEDDFTPRGIRIPVDKVAAVEKLLREDKSVTIQGRVYPSYHIINTTRLFTEDEWPDMAKGLNDIKPDPETAKKTWDELAADMRNSDWYRKSKAQKLKNRAH